MCKQIGREKGSGNEALNVKELEKQHSRPVKPPRLVITHQVSLGVEQIAEALVRFLLQIVPQGVGAVVDRVLFPLPRIVAEECAEETRVGMVSDMDLMGEEALVIHAPSRRKTLPSSPGRPR